MKSSCTYTDSDVTSNISVYVFVYGYFFYDFKKQKRGLYKCREIQCSIFDTNRNFTDQWDNWTFTTSALLHFRIRKKLFLPGIMRSTDFTRIESNIRKILYIFFIQMVHFDCREGTQTRPQY